MGFDIGMDTAICYKHCLSCRYCGLHTVLYTGGVGTPLCPVWVVPSQWYGLVWSPAYASTGCYHAVTRRLVPPCCLCGESCPACRKLAQVTRKVVQAQRLLSFVHRSNDPFSKIDDRHKDRANEGGGDGRRKHSAQLPMRAGANLSFAHSGNGVTAYADGGYWSHRTEDLVQHGLSTQSRQGCTGS